MPERRILIAGAGIGGLTTALALARAGFKVTLCERAEELAEVGAGIQISPNAGKVLAGLDLDTALAAAAVEPQEIDIRNGASGRTVLTIAVSEFRERYHFPYRVIHRAELQAILVNAVRAHDGIELRLATPVIDVNRSGDGVEIVTESHVGREDIRGDALIAADGVWSKLRDRIAPRPAAPTGRTAWRAIIAAAHAPAGLTADRVGLWLGRDGHLVHYPIARGAAINLVAIVDEDWHAEGWSAPGDPAQLAGHFKSWSKEVRDLIAMPTEWLKWALVAVDPDGPWCDGPLALLGDAAHAMAPYLAQGAAMAIEDAAVIAHHLAASPDDIPAAFRAYERARKPRTMRVWNTARDTGGYYHAGLIAGSARDLLMRTGGAGFVLGRNDWLYDWTPGA